MPWQSARQFKKRHFKKAERGQAGKARRIAEAMLAKGVDEGVAIATGIARAKGRKRGSHRGNPMRAATKRG